MEGTGGAGRTAVAASGSAEDFEEQHIELRHLSDEVTRAFQTTKKLQHENRELLGRKNALELNGVMHRAKELRAAIAELEERSEHLEGTLTKALQSEYNNLYRERGAIIDQLRQMKVDAAEKHREISEQMERAYARRVAEGAAEA